MHRLCLSLLLLCSACGSSPVIEPVTDGRLLPAEFVNDQVFLVAHRNDGETLRFFTDSGGGWNAISEDAVARLGLEADESINESPAIRFPEFPEASIPRPPIDNPMEGKLFVVASGQLVTDGFLGGRYFSGRIWDFDYPRRKLRVLEGVPKLKGNAVPLAFQENEAGNRSSNFARIAVTVAGQELDMLFDTGATVTLTDESAQAFGMKAGDKIGGSYIIRSVFDQWMNDHPEWPVIKQGDIIRGTTFRMIRVPEITIGDVRFGPVWFTERPDSAFREYMARFMDKPTSGAIGGSALRHVRVIVDFPDAKAYFSPPGT